MSDIVSEEGGIFSYNNIVLLAADVSNFTVSNNKNVHFISKY
jgi:hypothetical protein